MMFASIVAGVSGEKIWEIHTKIYDSVWMKGCMDY